MATDKVNVEIHLGFLVGPVDTDSEEKFSGTTSSTQEAFKSYLEEDFIESLIEEYDSFYSSTITKISVSTEMKDEGIDLTTTLSIETTDSPDTVYANLKKVIQSIGQKSIDQEIKKDDTTGTDFQVNSFIKITSIGSGQSAGAKRKSSKRKASKKRGSSRKSRSNRKRRTGKK